MPNAKVASIRQSRLDRLIPACAALPLAGKSITLEIGCGHGHYLTGYAEHHPDEYCIGLDLLSDRIRRATRKTDRAGLKNISWFHAEASDLLDSLPSGTLVSKILILFPDPWPKRRHWKNRLIQPEFLSLLRTRAADDAVLYFRTDHEPYFEFALEVFRQHPEWVLAERVKFPYELETVFQKRAERFFSLSASPSPNPTAHQTPAANHS